MKPLHTSSQVTASDSRMVVRVMEISTPDGPVRRIVVEANAEMDTTEARRLRDKLDLAITLAESPDPNMPCPCVFADPCSCPGWTAIKDCPCYRHGVANHEPAVSEDQPKPREETCGAGVEWSDGRRVCELDERHFGRHKNGNLLWWSDDRDQPASGDQLKPREWRKGDDEPPTDVTVLADQHGDLLTRRANGLWGWTRINGRKVNDMVPSPWADLAYWRDATAEEAERGALSEVLADSEQVTR